MTEADWIACTDPEPMLDHLMRVGASERKLRLYACAWGYDVWRRLSDDRSRDAVVVAERFADGLVGRAELLAAFKAAQEAWKEIRLVQGGRHSKWVKSQDGTRAAKWAAEVARNAADPDWNVRLARKVAWRANAARRYALANHLRDIFGDPFRKASIEPSWLTWNAATVPRIAQGIYDDHAFDQLPILADALEEAGCSDESILGHCRSEGRTSGVAGCWTCSWARGRP
jgi:hypothetical protein